jgi:glycosyltransferase involved in cell wall biosynthesis
MNESIEKIKKIVFLGYVWPEPRSSAAGLRTMNLMETFKNAGWCVRFVSAARTTDFSENLAAQGISSDFIQLNNSNFDTFITQEAPDYVVFDRFVTEEQLGWRVQKHSPESVRIVDTQDLHFLRRARERSLKGGASLDNIHLCNFEFSSDEDTFREIASIYRSDASLIISDFEMDFLVSRLNVPKSRIFLSRFQYPESQETTPYQDRANFVMIGNFRHLPNADAILWLKKEIWPEIHEKLPLAQVHVYGAYGSREIMSLTDPSLNFFVKGRMENHLIALQKYRINLAPLRFGAGIKGKISDGWWAGTPVVTTSIGAEGMSEQLPWGGEISNSTSDFAEKAVRLYKDEKEWRSRQDRGNLILRQLYSKKMNSKALVIHFEKLKAELKFSRKQNFIGGMLNHHYQKSTKYFSLWIETKAQLNTLASGKDP